MLVIFAGATGFLANTLQRAERTRLLCRHILHCDADVANGLHGLQSQKGGGAWQMERMRAAVLEEAHIVACTLSFAGSATFARMSRPFDVVVIDEAAQAVEPSVLVPLVNGCKQVKSLHMLIKVTSDDTYEQVADASHLWCQVLTKSQAH